MTENRSRNTDGQQHNSATFRADTTTVERLADSSHHRTLAIPSSSLVVLVGASGAGKSVFAASHFQPSEVLHGDNDRYALEDGAVIQAAFDSVRSHVEARMAQGELTVVDAANVNPEERAALIRMARAYDMLAVAIVLNLDERACREHNEARPDSEQNARLIHDQVMELHRSLSGIERQGFASVFILNTPEEIAAVRVERFPLAPDRRNEIGPFDLIGDLHGCYDELVKLLTKLGYREDASAGMRHPAGRRVVFLGDMVDRGPKVVETARLVMRMVEAGQALCAPGNHDVKLQRALGGRNVQVKHGLRESLTQIELLPPDERSTFIQQYCAFVDSLPTHYVLDGGALVVAHAGLVEAYHGRISGRVREFALYGETTGERDQYGLPIRVNWAADYTGKAAVIYGHTPQREAFWLHNTINIDTGCVFGGHLTALRWPERELVSVPALATYSKHSGALGVGR